MEVIKNTDHILKQYPSEQRYMLDALHEFQNTYGYVSSDHIKKIAEYFGLSMANVFSEISFYDKFTTMKPGMIIFQICDGTVCHTKGSKEIITCIEKKLGIKAGETTPDGRYTLKTVRCMGACEHAPVAVIDEMTCGNLNKEDIENALEDKFQGISNIIDNRHVDDISIIDCQYEKKLLNSAVTIDEYISKGGFKGLRRAFEFSRKRMILDEIKVSGLRGRSGSGFPVGAKWEAAYNAKGRSSNFIDKYVVANGDEGDPGAFMDRWLMENNPYAILEGMVTAGLCINANKGYIYIRDEYNKAIIRLENALKSMREMSFIGDRILNTDYSFDIEIIRAGRSYVCGEESALMESIEGRPGVPRIKPPFPTFRGVLEQPTLINNIETFANVPIILSEGGEEYRKTGTDRNTGTKVFSLSGALKNKGLVEVPMGKVTLRELVCGIGGGSPDGNIKCVQIGGPLGHYIPVDNLDIALDFDTFARNGYMLGSGGVIAIDENTSPIELLEHCIEFLADESCGTCTPCREGLRVLIDISKRIADGGGRLEDIKTVKKICNAAKIASRCALGKTIGNPVMSIIAVYEKELNAIMNTGGDQHEN